MRAPVLRFAVLFALGVSTAEIGRGADEPPLAITAIDPAHAAWGSKIKLVGRGLRGTKKVRFVVGYVKSKEAKFRVISDSELQVEVPEFFSTDIRAAIAVETAAGVTVTMPPELLTISTPSATPGGKFMLVQTGGAATEGGKWITFIEKDAAAVKAGLITLIASGGRVDSVASNVDPSANLIFSERGAIIGDQARKHATVVTVPHVFCSTIDELFTYDADDDAPDGSQQLDQSAAPHISAVRPNRGTGGDIIEIHGTGFGETKSVTFVQAGRRYEAAFRRKSDTVLRVEVPNVSGYWDAVIVVETRQGVAFTVARLPRSEDGTVTWVDKAGSHGGRGAGVGAGVALVEAGGLLARGNEVSFVKDGGTLLGSSGGVGAVAYCEPQAKLADPLPGSRVIVQVPKINPCPVDSYFNASRNRVPFGPSR